MQCAPAPDILDAMQCRENTFSPRCKEGEKERAENAPITASERHAKIKIEKHRGLGKEKKKAKEKKVRRGLDQRDTEVQSDAPQIPDIKTLTLTPLPLVLYSRL